MPTLRERLRSKSLFLKEVIIGFGFLSGVWIHLGFDPQSFVFSLLQQLVVRADPAHTQIITTLFFALPLALTAFAVLGAFRRAGWLGLFAVALAFAAGVLLNPTSVLLGIAALIIGFVAAKK